MSLYNAVLPGVPEGLSEAGHGGIESMLEVDERVIGPQAPAKFVASDDCAWLFEQGFQDLERLCLNFDSDAILPYVAAFQIDREGPEANQSEVTTGRHSDLPAKY